MSKPLWDSDIPPESYESQRFGRLRALRRGVPLFSLILICLPLMLLVRAVERAVVGTGRPWSSVFPQFVSRNALRLLGIKLVVQGVPMAHHGAVVANHSSWLDIFSLNACQKVFFVSKSEVANWPGIGFLAKSTGTVFIARARKDAAKQKQLFEKRLHMGHKLLFFPEGTSTDSLRVLPFKPTLFAALFAPELKSDVWIQPATVRYVAPEGSEARFYGWWGNMEFASSLMKLLETARHGRVEVIFHAPIAVKDVSNRKVMAQLCEDAVRNGLPAIPAEFLDV